MNTPATAIAGLALAVSAGLVGAGCGGGGSSRSGVASLAGSGSQRTTTTTVTKAGLTRLWHDFAACMRAHGVQMADPSLNNDGLPIMTGGSPVLKGDGPQQVNTDAVQACQPQLEAASRAGGEKGRKGPSPQQLAQGRKFAECMRAHGLTDFPDPQTAGAGNGIGIKITAGAGSDLEPNNPTFQTAQKACAKLMPKKGPGGPGGFVVNGSSR
jgi:hypothetical protein